MKTIPAFVNENYFEVLCAVLDWYKNLSLREDKIYKAWVKSYEDKKKTKLYKFCKFFGIDIAKNEFKQVKKWEIEREQIIRGMLKPKSYLDALMLQAPIGIYEAKFGVCLKRIDEELYNDWIDEKIDTDELFTRLQIRLEYKPRGMLKIA